jgi:glycerol-3-phosphate dehydrogenase
MRRDAMWSRVGQDEVDVLVIGGGINGAGIARDAAARGLGGRGASQARGADGAHPW